MDTLSDITARAVLGIFVGGRATRMGGVPKGLLPVHADAENKQTIVEALAARFLQAIAEEKQARDATHIVLVGEHAAYAHLPYPKLADQPAGVGPLGGVRALLFMGQREACRVVVVGCDMPYVTTGLFQALLTQHPRAACVAARRAERWEPLFSRFDPEPALEMTDRMLSQGVRALHRLLEGLDCQPLELDAEALDALDDWDEPGDVPPGCGSPLAR